MLTRCIYLGVTLFAVILASLILGFLIFNVSSIAKSIGRVVSILLPFVYGFAFAFLMLPLYNAVYDWVKNYLKSRTTWTIATIKSWAKIAAIICAVAVFLLIVVGLISLVIPQLIESITKLINEIPDALAALEKWLAKVFEDNPQVYESIDRFIDQIAERVNVWVNESLIPQAESILTRVTSGVASVFRFFYNVIIGLIAAIYMLLSKDKFSAQGKMIIKAMFRETAADRILTATLKTHEIFGGFISGKLIDSLIIGVICFILMLILRLPYALLISVIIGVTNIIPFFGPLFGAIPSAIILLTENPWNALTFLIMVVILQQFDGNYLGPRILGETTGIAGFWVMFSIVLFGGLWGFVGMVVGVPIWALLYYFFSEWIKDRLEKRGLPRDVPYYEEENKSRKRERDKAKRAEQAKQREKSDAVLGRIKEKLKCLWTKIRALFGKIGKKR